MLNTQTLRAAPTGDPLTVTVQTSPPLSPAGDVCRNILRWLGVVGRVVAESAGTWGAYVSQVRTNFDKGTVEVVSSIPMGKGPEEVEAQIQQALADAPAVA